MKLLVVFASFPFLLASCNVLASGIAIEQVGEGVHILNGKEYGTNIGLVRTDERVVLIDPMPGEAYLLDLHNVVRSIYDEATIYILNTHNHEDHTGGNAFFIEMGGRVVQDRLEMDGIERILVNSHTTQDHVYFHKKSNSLFVGDVFDNNWHPTFYSGGISGFDAAIDRILLLGDAESLIIPGHGKLANKSTLREFRKSTHEWVNQIRKLHADGMPLDMMMENEAVLSILNQFNNENRSPFLPPNAFRRFIERTISLLDN